jgi:type IV pilus assembly protein PilY1
MQFYDGSNLLMVPTQIPAKGSRLDPNVESCEGGAVDRESQYVTFINIMDGQAPRVPIIDGPNGLARYTMPPGALTMIVKGSRIHMRGRQPKPGGTGSDLVEEKMRRMPEMSLRPNWRQLK